MNDLLSINNLNQGGNINLSFASNLDLFDILISLILTFLISLFIFYIYKKIFKGVLYTQSYNISLVMISLVTCLVIMTISTNLILSLGMVGALSIVRFRTAVKDPLDIVFMFWAIGIGIANGAQQYYLAIIGSLFIGLVIYGFANYKSYFSPYLIIFHYKTSDEEDVINIINKSISNHKMKSKTISNDIVEYTIEVRLKNNNSNILKNFNDKKIVDVSMVSYDGDYTS